MAKKKNKKSKYGSMNKKAREQNKKHKNSRGGGGWNQCYRLPENVELFTPKKGKMHLDLIPYEVTAEDHPEEQEAGQLWYRRIMLVHPNVGPSEKNYLCPKTFDEDADCPVCEFREKMRRDPDADEDEVKKLWPKERELFNIVDLDDEDTGVQLWDVSTHLFGKLLEATIDEEDDEVFPADLEGGKTLKVKFKEQKLGKRKWLEAIDIEFEDRDDYEDDIVQEAVKLDDVIIVTSYDDLEKEFAGAEDDEDEDEDEKPAKKKRRTRKAKSEPEEEDPEEDDPEEEADEDEDEKPKRRRRRRAKPEPEDEDEPDPEEEELEEEKEEKEEEEKPKKRRRRKAKSEPEEEEEEEEDPEEEDEKPKRRRRRRRA